MSKCAGTHASIGLKLLLQQLVGVVGMNDRTHEGAHGYPWTILVMMRI